MPARGLSPIGLEAVGVTARTQQPLRKKSGPTLNATPDADAWGHAATTMILVNGPIAARLEMISRLMGSSSRARTRESATFM